MVNKYNLCDSDCDQWIYILRINTHYPSSRDLGILYFAGVVLCRMWNAIMFVILYNIKQKSHQIKLVLLISLMHSILKNKIKY